VTASDLHAREGGEIGGNRPVMILTPRWSSGSSLQRQRSGRAAEQRAAKSVEAAAEKLSWLRVSGEGPAAAWGKPRARGRRLYRAAEALWRAGLRRRAGGAAPDCGRTRARVRARHGEREGPDRRDPPTSETGREGRGRHGWFGPGRERVG
jgi:hypothetical protein